MRSLLLGLGLLLAAPAWAQQPHSEPGYTPMDGDSFLEAIQGSPPDGWSVSVSWLRYNKLFDDQLKVYDDGFDRLLRVRDPGLKDQLNEGKDSAGQRLAKDQNVQVLGVGRRLPNGGYVLLVKRLYGLEDDPARYTRLAKALQPADADGRLKLARSAIARARTSLQGSDRALLYRLARQLEDQAREIERQALPPLPGGAEAWLRYGTKYRQIAALSKVWETAGAPQQLRDRAQALLEQLHARRYLGHWLSEDDLREQVGFVREGKRWIPRELADLKQAAAAQLRYFSNPQNPWPPLPDRMLSQSARGGEILAGQTKDMVLAAILKQNRGKSQLPVRVDRYREPGGGQSGGEWIWERWELADGHLLYFVQDRAFKDTPPGE